MEKLCLGCMQMKQCVPFCEHCGFDERTENQPHQLPMGTLLQNQYLVGKVLGQGGFGITYMGWDQHLSIPVAIKEYYPGGAVQRNSQWGSGVMCSTGEAPEVFARHRTRFLKEARTLAQLSGIPEIVQIKSFFPENNTAYIVMEYVEGITLKDHLKNMGRPMTEPEALEIMEPVLKALQKVHDHGLIHRDISPDNIMLPKKGGVKLIDFGTVRYMDDSGKSKSTEAVLKPGFAPMEQYNSRGNLGTWTDVYAICATFHYLLTGKVPEDVHDRLEQGEILKPLRSKTGISKQLIAALEKGMKIRSQERLQTVGELYRLLYPVKKSRIRKQPKEKSPVKKQPKETPPVMKQSKEKPPRPKQPKEKRPASPKMEKGKGGLLTICAVAAVSIAAGAMLLIPPKQKPTVSIQVPEITEVTTPTTTVPETTVPETTLPELSPEECSYREAEALAAAGEYGKAAIAFGKLGDYADARQRSFALWDQVAVRDTIAVGGFHTLALRNNGTVYATGENIHAFNGVTHQAERMYPECDPCDVDDWKNIIAVSAETGNSAGLRADGTVVVVGRWKENGKQWDSEIQKWKDIVSICSGGRYGLKSDGTVVTAYAFKQSAVSDWSDIIAIACANNNVFGLKTDGTVVGDKDFRDTEFADSVAAWTDIVKIYGSEGVLFGLKADGTVVAAGRNDYGQADVSGWTEIRDLCASGFLSVGVKSDGTVAAAGRLTSWYDPTEWTYIEAVAVSENHAVGLRADGTMVATGNIAYSRCNVSEWNDIRLPN